MKKQIRTVGAFLEYDNKFLILYRSPSESNGELWGLPAGKVEKDESDVNAIIREVFEETGLKLTETEVELIDVYRWEFPKVDIDFPTFKVKLDNFFDVILNPEEHSEYRWVTPQECFELKDKLIHGFDDLLDKVYGLK